MEVGVSYDPSDLYAPTLKAPEARLLVAITAEHDCPLLKTNTRQAFKFIYKYMGEDEKVYIRPPDWWPEPFLKVTLFSYFSNTCMA